MNTVVDTILIEKARRYAESESKSWDHLSQELKDHYIACATLYDDILLGPSLSNSTDDASVVSN